MARQRPAAARVPSSTDGPLSRLLAPAVISAPYGYTPAPGARLVIDTTSKTSVETLAAYQIDSGDRLRITVLRHVDLSGEFVLDDRGNLALPLIGEVRGSGRTLRDLKSQIETAFTEGGFLVNPQVGVEVLGYRPFYILGEGNHPDSNAHISGMTGITAVAMAGGFINRARQSSMTVQRCGENERWGKGLANTAPSGDILNIEERFFR